MANAAAAVRGGGTGGLTGKSWVRAGCIFVCVCVWVFSSVVLRDNGGGRGGWEMDVGNIT